MYKSLTILLLALSLTIAQAQSPVLQEAKPETVGVSSERLARIDRVLQQYVTDQKEPGMIGFIARNGKIVYYKAFGQADAEMKKPMARDAIVRIASQTKALTSIGAMILFEEGKFLLDDPVAKYIPAFKTMTVLDKFNEKDTTYTTVAAKRAITIRQLLTHTSGIGYPVIGSKEMNAIYAKNRIPSGIGTPNANLGEAMTRLAALPLSHQPGERWTYGLSVDLLGYLVEVWSGQTLDQFLRERLFTPLGMNDTYFYLPTDKQARLTKLYTEDDKGTLIPSPPANSPDFPKTTGTYYSGGAGASSTAYDYAVFLQMLLNGGEYNGKRILSPATVRLITANQIGDLSLGDNKFGLGFSITSAKGAAKTPVSEGSFEWGGIFGTTYWADPKEGIVALILTQKFPNTSAGDLADKFKVQVYQALTTLNSTK